MDNAWYYGELSRTAWLDSPLLSVPIAAYGQKLVYHETGVDDDTTGVPVGMGSFIESSDFDIGDGHNFGFVWRMLPDLTFNGSTVTDPVVMLTTKARTGSGTNYVSAASPDVTRTSTIPIEQYTNQVYTRVRGRQMAFRIESATVGVQWQLGAPRNDIRPDGRKT